MTDQIDFSAALDDEVLAEAMNWRQRMSEGEFSIDDEVELEVWLQADERRLLAFEQIGKVSAVFEPHAASPELLMQRLALLRRVRREATGRWIEPTAVLNAPSRRAAAGALAASVIAGVGLWTMVGRGAVYSTGVGERRVIILDDGSVVSLDARSRLSVRYSARERRLELHRGQARFDVAHDPSRPFSVTARQHTVVATGTAFNIDLLAPEMRVTLIEGRVLVLPEKATLPRARAPASGQQVELRAGQALVARKDQKVEIVAKADLNQATSWQQGQLVFNDEPLGQAVERVSRYTEQKITVGDADAAAIPVSGTFNAGDAKAFLEAVSEFLPVRVVTGADGVILQSIHSS